VPQVITLTEVNLRFVMITLNCDIKINFETNDALLRLIKCFMLPALGTK
jgi:hypothetical protein